MLFAAEASSVIPTSAPRALSAFATLAAAAIIASLPEWVPETIRGFFAPLSACTTTSSLPFSVVSKSPTAGALLSMALAIAKPKRA